MHFYSKTVRKCDNRKNDANLFNDDLNLFNDDLNLFDDIIIIFSFFLLYFYLIKVLRPCFLLFCTFTF